MNYSSALITPATAVDFDSSSSQIEGYPLDEQSRKLIKSGRWTNIEHQKFEQGTVVNSV
jgi:hypothetical protein